MNKKCFLAFAAVALAIGALLPGKCAFAANGILVIDSSHLYQGMDKTYSQGYSPAVSNGTADICLPLVVSEVYGETIPKREITVTAETGTGEDNPFVPGEHQKTVSLQSREVRDENGAAVTVGAFYVRLDLPLRPRRVNGRYPVVIRATYVNGVGESVRQSFTVYAEITNGGQSAPAPAPAGEGTPGVAVSRYEVRPPTVQAGTAFTVDVTLKNTSTSQAARDIVVSYEGKTGDLAPESDTNTFFVSRMDKDAEQTFRIKMKAAVDAKTSVQQVLFSIVYLDENSDKRTAGGEVPVPVKQPIRIGFDDPSVPEKVYAGEALAVTLTIRNFGKGTLCNVAAILQAEGFAPEGPSYLGDMEAGGVKIAQLRAAAADRPGGVQGSIVVSYEDENGEKFSEKVPVESEILPLFLGMPAGRGALWLAAGIAAAAVYFIWKYVILPRKKKGAGG